MPIGLYRKLARSVRDIVRAKNRHHKSTLRDLSCRPCLARLLCKSGTGFVLVCSDLCFFDNYEHWLTPIIYRRSRNRRLNRLHFSGAGFWYACHSKLDRIRLVYHAYSGADRTLFYSKLDSHAAPPPPTTMRRKSAAVVPFCLSMHLDQNLLHWWKEQKNTFPRL